MVFVVVLQEALLKDGFTVDNLKQLLDDMDILIPEFERLDIHRMHYLLIITALKERDPQT